MRTAALLSTAPSPALLVVLAIGLATPAASMEWRPAADGDFLTAWYVAGPTSARRGAQLLAAGEPGGRPWKPLIGGTPVVDGGRSRKPRQRQETWFGVVLVAERPMTVELKLGTSGHLAVFLDGTERSSWEKNHDALWDDHLLRLELSAGRHPLLIRTRRRESQRGAGWQIVARVHDPATSTVPAGLTFELPGLDKPGLRLAQASTLRAERTIVRGGYRLTLELPQTGSAPVGATGRWTAKLAGQREPIASGQIGGPAVAVDLQLPSDKTYLLSVTAEGRTWREKFIYQRAWNEGLTTARENLARTRRARFPEATLASVEYNVQKLEGHVLESIPDTRWLGEQIRKVRSWTDALAGGADPFVTQREDFYRAYRSRYDGNLQPYSVHVPPQYDRDQQRWPLVIGMHGIGSGTHYTLRRVLGRDRDKEGGEPGGKPLIRGNMPRLPNYGVITASAWGYHNSAFWFYGEDDVLRVVEEMKATYRIDPDRVYLTGLSLGGLGTYHIGARWPDVFAALGPLGGFSSVKLYRQIRSHPKTWWEDVLIEQRDATTYAENGMYTPMKVVHGRRDGPRHATAMTDRYRAMNYTVELDIPEAGHDVWQYSYGDGALVRWMMRFVRPSAPDEVVYKTMSYRHLRAYWVRIGWIDDYMRPALLRVHVDKDDRSRVVVDTASNLRGFTLDLGRARVADGPAPLTIQLPDGTATVQGRGPTHFRRVGAGPWHVADTAAPPAGHKRPGASGPVDDIMYEPHTFVVGTTDPAQTDVNRRLVAEDHTYLRHHQHDIWFPIVDDTAVDEATLRGNLVLYGNPASNAVLARMLETGKLPLRFDDDALMLGERRFDGDDVGIKMAYPNPFAPDKTVVIVAGVTWRGTLLSRYLPRHVPDLIVWDRRLQRHYDERILIDRPVRLAGYFRSDWSLPPDGRP